jgi:hypothetical protein
MSIKFQVKRSNNSTWSSANPTLASGELGFETDTNKLKIGNGSNTWNTLSYIAGGIVDFGTTSNVSTTTMPADIRHIRTAGYYSEGDGGGALYKLYSTNGTVPSHGGYITSNAGQYVWEIAEKIPNVRQFGARGNNTNNDISPISNSLSFLGVAGGTLLFPAGNYRVESSINVNTPVSLQGLGSGSVYQPAQSSSVTITWAGSVGGDIIRFGGFGNGNTSNLISGGGIIGIKIDGAASAAHGLRIKDSQRAYFRDVTITGTTAFALLMENSISSNTSNPHDPSGLHIFDDLRIQLRGGATQNATGIYVNGSWGSGAEGHTLCTFRRCRIDHANGTGVLIGSIGDAFQWDSLQTFRADVETGESVWFNGTGVGASNTLICGGHQFYGSLVNGGFRFDAVGSGPMTRIINPNHIDVASTINPINLVRGAGAIDVISDSSLGFSYGMGLLHPIHVFQKRDNCSLIRYDANNSVLHTAEANWKTNVSSGGNITENGQPGSGLNLSTGTTANDITVIYDNATFGQGGFASYYSIAGDWLVAPVSSANVVYRFGWADSANTSPTNGIYLQYDPSINANWQLVCTKAGNTTVSNSSVAPLIGSKQELYIFVEPGSAGATAYFRTEGNRLYGSLARGTANIPTAQISTISYVRTKNNSSKRVDVYGIKTASLDEV